MSNTHVSDASLGGVMEEQHNQNKRPRTNDKEEALQTTSQKQQQPRDDEMLIKDEALETAKCFILQVFSNWETEDRKELWDRLSEYFQEDPEIALAALTHEGRKTTKSTHIRLGDMPDSLLKNKEFLLEAVSMKPELWLDLPAEFENDMSFVYNILPELGESEEIVKTVFQRFPQARGDQRLWKRLVHYRWSTGFYISEYAPVSIRSDPDLMFQACCTNDSCFRLVHSSLFEDRTFVERILQSPKFLRPLKHIPHHVQIRWPELVIESFGRIRDQCTPTINHWQGHIEDVAPALWTTNDHRVKYGWFQAGCPFIKESFPAEWKEDRKIFLLIAEHSFLDPVGCLEQMSTSLKESKEYMMQLVELNPLTLLNASSSLRMDCDLLTVAFANKHRSKPYHAFDKQLEEKLVIDVYKREDSVLCEPFFSDLRTKAQEKVDAHTALTKLILPAIKFGGGASNGRFSSSSSCSSLSLLNQGSETQKAYMTCVAEFADVPIGKDLRLYRQALHNLPKTHQVQSIIREYDKRETRKYKAYEIDYGGDYEYF